MVAAWITRDDLTQASHPFADSAVESASWILFKLSGEKYTGAQTVTEWYGRNIDKCWSSAQHILRYLGPLNSDPRVDPFHLRLRGIPVLDVARVGTVDGELAIDDYQLVNRAFLRRTDGQRWNLDAGVEVEYSYGVLPPEAGRQAAIVLADQLVLASTNSQDCKLPERVTSVSRQGTSWTILDPQEFIRDGRTGLYEVDLFLAAANPYKAKKRARVFSIDVPRGQRRI